MQKLLTTIILFLAFACQKTTVEPTIYSIDADLQIYTNSFVEEAKKRGVEIKMENLIMAFGKTSEEICGQCTQPKNGVGQRTITISSNEDCWKNAPKEDREALVFHEFGHCLLGRVHRNDLLPNGAVASIMNSENNSPYGPCLYPIGGDNSCNKTSRRSYYLDELFNPQTSAPAWSK